jgi:hypothetical protein
LKPYLSRDKRYCRESAETPCPFFYSYNALADQLFLCPVEWYGPWHWYCCEKEIWVIWLHTLTCLQVASMVSCDQLCSLWSCIFRGIFRWRLFSEIMLFWVSNRFF